MTTAGPSFAEYMVVPINKLVSFPEDIDPRVRRSSFARQYLPRGRADAPRRRESPWPQTQSQPGV